MSGSRWVYTTTSKDPVALMPSDTKRCSPTASPSSRVSAQSSVKMVAASEKATPCALRLASAFLGCHSMLTTQTVWTPVVCVKLFGAAAQPTSLFDKDRTPAVRSNE